MSRADASSIQHVQKACAYLTRPAGELLVFESVEHDGLQVPKGTVEDGEGPRAAVLREIAEESGLGAVTDARHVATDVWWRRRSPPKRYVRHFFHARVHEPRDSFTHVVADGGAEHGLAFEYSWVDLPPEREFALALDDYLHCIE
jgi:8-oxo-dGTP pyrophosphatase MutT (NUDIX family)